MSIRRKISLGFVVIGVILLMSSVIGIYELISTRRSVSAIIADNIESINASRILLEITDEYNFLLMQEVGLDTVPTLDALNSTVFTSILSDAKGSYSNLEVRNMTDSILYAYTAYVHVLKEAPNIWQEGYAARRGWFFGRLYPVYMQLRNYIQSLTDISQEALKKNSKNMSDTFYRSIMPGVVSFAIGIGLLILFNYFINQIFITPLLAISTGIKKYINSSKRYDVDVRGDGELGELNEEVKELIESNENLLRNLGND